MFLQQFLQQQPVMAVSYNPMDPTEAVLDQPTAQYALHCRYVPEDGRWYAVTALNKVTGEEEPLPACFEMADECYKVLSARYN